MLKTATELEYRTARRYTGEDVDRIATRAAQILFQNMERFGNTLSAQHKAHLSEMLQRFAKLALGLKRGRFAYPLNCGLGKTQSVVAFCAALHQLGYDDVSVAVAASKVKQLCDLKKSLERNGIPEAKVGLLHSYKYDRAHLGEEGYADVPRTSEGEERQFQLVSHNRIKGRTDLRHYYYRNGRMRDLLIWDESLLVSDCSVMSIVELEASLGWVRAYQPTGCPVVAYLEIALSQIGVEVARQKAHGEAAPKPIELPLLSGETIREFKAQLVQREQTANLRQFLDMSQQPIRAVYGGREDDKGIVTYDVVVPSEMENIVILDASYPIRYLERLDPSITLGMPFDPKLKRHDRVTVHHLRAPSGRQSTTRDFKGGRLLTAEVCELVRAMAVSEAVIVFTFKPREHWNPKTRSKESVDFKGTLRQEMKRAGIDLDATVPVSVWRNGGWQEEQQPRLVFRTWGEETSDSEHSYARHVIFAGVLHRSRSDLASWVIGQKGDLWAKVDDAELRHTLDSEIAHSLYQAMNRGQCRVVDGDQAKPMDVWLIHRGDRIRGYLEEVMPGLKWKRWEPKFLLPKGGRHKLVQAIRDCLEDLSPCVRRVSVKELKRRLGLAETPAGSTFRRAMASFLEGNSEWRPEGRSVVRCDYAYYFGGDSITVNTAAASV